MKRDETFDVAIIGAGAAGLLAAGELARAGRRIVVLEARGELGGRIRTVADEQGVPIELGAEFVHELSPELESLLDQSATPLAGGEGEHFELKARSLKKVDGFWEDVVARLDELRPPSGKDRAMAQLLGPPRTRRDRFAWRFVEGFNAAPARELSAQALLRSHREAMRNGGYETFRPIGGARRLIDALLARLDPPRVELRRHARVTRVAWRRGHVRASVAALDGRTTEVRTRALLVTVPAAVLARRDGDGAIGFEPPIPAKVRAAAALGAGAVVKMIVKLAGPLAQPKLLELRPQLGEAQFLHVDGAAFPTWWTTWPLRSSILTGWAGGPDAERLSRLDERGILESALGTLARILGVPRSRVPSLVERHWLHDWQRDPYARGAYSFVRVGEQRAPEELARPLDATLFFAGEATATGGVGGTIGSALSSGKRAAEEILATLERPAAKSRVSRSAGRRRSRQRSRSRR